MEDSTRGGLIAAGMMLEMGMLSDVVLPDGLSREDCLMAAHDIIINLLYRQGVKQSTHVALAAVERSSREGLVMQ